MNKATFCIRQVTKDLYLKPLLRLAGVAAVLAGVSVSAQAPLDVRVALIIGNSAYANSPLVNPANDARAMGEILRSLGFQVIELRDGSKAQMSAAIIKVSDALKGKQGVGMLYYAGHGLQLDWRNYMVPVDASLTSAADVPRQTIDLAGVIEIFKGAGNRMNIVVLDACRDNPFGASTSSAKGLAQLDAPPSTFLAYATAPGNVAEDGDEKSGNGLYTRFLLQELKRPTARIEDVFKRVRLNVRKQSQGRQIPWESTSLEEDFYFNDGVVRVTPLIKAPEQKMSKEQARELAFNEEKAAWDVIRTSTNADDYYAFLQRFPSGGDLAEMAQYRLDQLAKPKITAALGQDQDASLGYTGARLKVGDTFEVQVSDLLTNLPGQRRTHRVTSIDGDTAVFNNGSLILTVLGAVIKNGRGSFDPPLGGIPVEFQVGKKWSGSSTQTGNDGRTYKLQLQTKIVGRETITVPAGTFQTYVIENTLYVSGGPTISIKRWVDPRYAFAIKSEELGHVGGRIMRSDRWELVAIKADRS